LRPEDLKGRLYVRRLEGPPTRVTNPFVLISGLPGSGKTTLARRLAPALDLPLIDKDDILDRLFAAKGTGGPSWRRTLSRESDAMLETEAAAAAGGAVLVSFWRLPGMPADSGTPTDWLASLSEWIVNIECVCDPAIAADRFLRRSRHPGHLDGGVSADEVLASIRRVAGLGSLEIGRRVRVDTSREPVLEDVVRDVREAFARSRPGGRVT